MRLVATSDTHFPVDVNFIPDGDVFVHAGDLMKTGYPDDFARQLKWLKQLPHAIKLYVPGNHDFHLQVYPGPALQQLRDVGVWVIGLPGNPNYETYTLPNGMRVLGLPFVKDLPRWSFNVNSVDEGMAPEIKSVLDRHSYSVFESKTPEIFVSHSPPYYVLDEVNGEHRGCEEYNHFMHEYMTRHPKHWIFGHIHEGYGTKEWMGTKFYNVAMCNRAYEHVNPPMVIDL